MDEAVEVVGTVVVYGGLMLLFFFVLGKLLELLSFLWRRVRPQQQPAPAGPLPSSYTDLRVDVLDKYSNLLESGKTLIMPESALPAPKSLIKFVLINEAKKAAAMGRADYVEVLRTACCALADFVPNEVAARTSDFDHPDSRDYQAVVREGAALIREFDASVS